MRFTRFVRFPGFVCFSGFVRFGWTARVRETGFGYDLRRFGLKHCGGFRRFGLEHGRFHRIICVVIGCLSEIRKVVGNAFRLRQHAGDRTRLRAVAGIGGIGTGIAGAGRGGIALSASHVVFGGADRTIHQHPRILGNIGATRILGSQQRLPSFQRQIAFAHMRTAIARIRACQLVHFLVARVAGMTLDQHESHRPRPMCDLIVDGADQIGVLHRFLLRILPAVALPTLPPLGGAVDRILRVGLDHQVFGTGMRSQRLQHGA